MVRSSTWIWPRIPQRLSAKANGDTQNDEPTVRTLVELADHNAVYNPEHMFCIQQVQTKSGLQFVQITYRLLKAAVYLYSRRILQQFRDLAIPVDNDFQSDRQGPIAILLEGDVDVLIYTLAIQSLHRPVLLLSSRLNPNAMSLLLRQTRAAAIIVSESTVHTAKIALDTLSLQGERGIQVLTSPGLVSALDSINAANPKGALYNRPKDFDDLNPNALIMHSSGTTGLPKAIYHCHRWTLLCGGVEDAESSITQGVLALTASVFHAYGFLISTRSLATGLVVCLPIPSAKKIDGKARLEWLRACQADHFATVPSVLQDLSQLPNNEGLQALANLKYVAYSGCTMKGSLGDACVAAGVRLSPIYGSTEAGVLSAFTYYNSAHHNWRYFKLRQDVSVYAKPSSIDQPDEAIHKLVVNVPGWTAPFELQDDIRASDTNPGHFTVCGRLDDVIVLSHGQNVMPHVIETALTDSSLIKAAVAFGSEQPELGALVIPSSPVRSEQMDTFTDEIFSLVKGISNSTREDIHYKEALVVLPHDAELEATEKGSIKRREMLQRYQKQIEEAYEKIRMAECQRTDGLSYTKLA